jgi:hypothetical protein
MEVVGGTTFLFFHIQKGIGYEELVSQTHPPLLFNPPIPKATEKLGARDTNHKMLFHCLKLGVAMILNPM